MSLINSVGSSFILYNTVIVLYLAGTVAYFLFLISHRKEVGKIASTVTFSGWIVNTAALVGRGFADHHAPWSNLYETLFLFSWASVLGYMVMEFKYKVRVAGAFVLTLVMFAVGAARMLPYRYQMVEPLNPAQNMPPRVDNEGGRQPMNPQGPRKFQGGIPDQGKRDLRFPEKLVQGFLSHRSFEDPPDGECLALHPGEPDKGWDLPETGITPGGHEIQDQEGMA